MESECCIYIYLLEYKPFWERLWCLQHLDPSTSMCIPYRLMKAVLEALRFVNTEEGGARCYPARMLCSSAFRLSGFAVGQAHSLNRFQGHDLETNQSRHI